jgi:hypothetical protein
VQTFSRKRSSAFIEFLLTALSFSEVDVGLSITEITTSKGAIERFKPEERDCYTADEVNLVSLPLKKGYRDEIERTFIMDHEYQLLHLFSTSAGPAIVCCQKINMVHRIYRH